MLASRLFSIVKPQSVLGSTPLKQFFGAQSVYFNRSSTLLKQQFSLSVVSDRSSHRLFTTTTTTTTTSSSSTTSTPKPANTTQKTTTASDKAKKATKATTPQKEQKAKPKPKKILKAIDYTKKLDENQTATSSLVAKAKVVPENPPIQYPIPSKLNDSIIAFNNKLNGDELATHLKTLPESFAVVALSGKQYKITEGDVIQTDKLKGVVPGAIIQLDKVLLLGSRDKTFVGTPLIPNARVEVEVQEQTKAEKIIIFKMKRRKNYRRTRGFRPSITVLRITRILFAEDLYPITTFTHQYPTSPILKVTKKRIEGINKTSAELAKKWQEKKDKRHISRKGMNAKFVRV